MNPKVTEYIKNKEAWQQEILNKLRELVHEGDPEIEEAIKWNAPWFGHGGKPVAWMFCAKEWIHFSFPQGALLDHSKGLFEPTDNKAMRTIKFRSGDIIPEKTIIKLTKDSTKLIQEGKAVKFNIPKRGEKEFDVPKEYEAILKEKGMWDEYQNRPYYQQKGWVQWIEEAKLTETREKRTKTMIKELKNGSYMPPKK